MESRIFVTWLEKHHEMMLNGKVFCGVYREAKPEDSDPKTIHRNKDLDTGLGIPRHWKDGSKEVYK